MRVIRPRSALVPTLLLALFLGLVLGACGQAPSILITLDSTAVEVLRGGDVQVQVTLTRRGGASADVTVSVSGLPANVSASFSPPILSGGTLSSTLTINAVAAASEGSYDLSVTGLGAGLTASSPLALDVSSLDLTGRVVSIYDLPLAGAIVASQGLLDVTDADGSFSLSGLVVPYDLSVWNSTEEWAHVYEGLTAGELLLAPVADLPPVTAKSATLSGTLSGGVIPVGPDQVVMVCVEGVNGFATGCDTVQPTENSYAITVQWLDSTSRQIRVHALQFEMDAVGYPVAYLGYSSVPMTLTDGNPAVGNLNLGTALQARSVHVELETEVAVIGTSASVQVSPGLALPVALITSAATSHDFLMPILDGASYAFAGAVDIDHFGWKAGVTGTTVTVRVLEPVSLITPPDNTSGVTTSTGFLVSKPSGTPVTYVWWLGGLRVAVTTMAPTHTIPDPALFGLSYPAATQSSWLVYSHLGPGVESGTYLQSELYRFLLLVLNGASQGLVGEGTIALSEEWDFTTAP